MCKQGPRKFHANRRHPTCLEQGTISTNVTEPMQKHQRVTHIVSTNLANIVTELASYLLGTRNSSMSLPSTSSAPQRDCKEMVNCAAVSRKRSLYCRLWEGKLCIPIWTGRTARRWRIMQLCRGKKPYIVFSGMARLCFPIWTGLTGYSNGLIYPLV
ncbi:hypothetical protein RHMOL_Rhmol12G0106000 [Rhododendron molle]|uniref:Uncharacterized protein n=2 Tax=Rhododendron molle TaxID=49168 RepID=A0ACC0LI54_RHOML|nr:hypothetical protein RHMOL_Rhmol12G0106000 [Rhododendron molle]KAI8527853.1 hypothetical protein RHMOL_Rhmol12G0106000 [Rhododendron molle]